MCKVNYIYILRYEEEQWRKPVVDHNYVVYLLRCLDCTMPRDNDLPSIQWGVTSALTLSIHFILPSEIANPSFLSFLQ